MSAPDAWRDLLGGLDRLAERLLADDFPSDAAGRDETFRHLAQQLVCWLEWAVAYGDPSRPAFQRQNDFVTPWGGPNADNVYRHARVSPRHTYRIRGRMHSCEDFALAVREGFRHTDSPATLAELTASDIGIAEGDEFELLLGGEGDEPNRVPLPDGAIMCSIREYYFDWRPAEPATLTIECTGGDSDAADVGSPPSYGDALHEALDLTERSLVFWNDYMRAARDRQEDNTFGGKVDVPRGLKLSQFGFCFFDLGPDDALVVDCDRPDARYWSFQLYGMHLFRPFDLARPTSVNHRQAVIGDDDRLELVVAARDPGVANWLDTGGRNPALLNYRHFWGSAVTSPRARLVPLDAVRDALRPGTPVFDRAARAAQVRARRDHLAWRFRT